MVLNGRGEKTNDRMTEKERIPRKTVKFNMGKVACTGFILTHGSLALC